MAMPWDNRKPYHKLCGGRAPGTFERPPPPPSAADRLKKVFDSVAGADGVISREELHTKLRADGELEKLLGLRDTDGLKFKGVIQMDAVLVATDASEDGVITWAEFSNAVAVAEAKAVFTSVAGADGTISRDEFHAKLRADGELEKLLGFKDTDGLKFKGVIQMDAVLVATDASEDGVITWEEFEKSMENAKSTGD